MKKAILALVVMISITASAQDIPKKANTIELTGVSFREVGNALLDAGYTFEKVDSSFQTIKTEFKEGTIRGSGHNQLLLLIRVKDSTAIITGRWYNEDAIGVKLLGTESTIENSTIQIAYTFGRAKTVFLEMNAFAESFQKPITYTIK